MERSLQAIANRDGGDPPSLFLRLPAATKLAGPGPTHDLPHGRGQPLPPPCPDRRPRGRVATDGPRQMERVAPRRHALSSPASFSA